VLPDTVVAYADSTIAFPLFCEYVVGSPHSRRERKRLYHRRDELVSALHAEALRAARERAAPSEQGEAVPDSHGHR
jgi:hypothetical protein